MRIREAIQTDAAGIAAVVHAMKESRSVASQSVEMTAGTVASNLRRVGGSGNSMALVAEDSKGAIAGYCAVHWVPFLFFAGGEAYVTELFVRPSDSGKGIGSRLLQAVVEEAGRRGCSRVSLLNGRDSEAYQRGFYRKRGWVERERMVNFVLPLTNAPEPSSETNPPAARS